MSSTLVRVGGVAAVMHGTSRATLNLDIVYRRTPDNIDRLVLAGQPYRPNIPGAPPDFLFSWNAATIQRGLNFSLTTDVGDLNVLGTIVGGGSYEALLPFTLVVQIFGADCRLLGLDRLIEITRAAGRPQDFEIIAELETIRDLQRSFHAA